MGLSFTIAEMWDGLLMRIGSLELNPFTDRVGGDEFNSPWGDALLAFSAFCMLAEEFRLVNLYGYVKGKLKEDFEAISLLIDRARDKLDELEELQNKSRYFTIDREKGGETYPFLVFLKWCSVVGGIILLLWVLIKVEKLENSINVRPSDSGVGTSSDPEGRDRESERDDTGQELMLLEQTTEDTDESSTVDFTDSPGMHPNRPDGP